jgi:hypothetical protein
VTVSRQRATKVSSLRALSHTGFRFKFKFKFTLSVRNIFRIRDRIRFIVSARFRLN